MHQQKQNKNLPNRALQLLLNGYVLVFVTVNLLVSGMLWYHLRPHGDIVFFDVTEGINPGNVFQRYFTTYDDHQGLSLVEQSRTPLFLLIWSVYRLLGVSFSGYIKVKIFFVYLLSALSFILAVKILRPYLPKELSETKRFWLGLFLGVSFYLLNPWMTNRLMHFGLFFATFNLPLVFALYYEILFSPHFSLHKVIWLAIFLGFTLATPHTLLFDGVIILTLTIFGLLTKSRRSILTRLSKTLPLLAVLSFLLNLYWILPYLSSGGLTPLRAESLDMVKLLAQNAAPLNALRLMGYWWVNLESYFSLRSTLRVLQKIASALPPIISLWWMLRNLRENLLARALLFLTTSAFLLGSATTLSLTLYRYLIFTPPLSKFGWLFRELDKFAILLTLSFSLALTFQFNSWLKKNTTTILALAVSSLIGLFVIPYFWQTLQNNYSPQTIPAAFYQANQFLSLDRENFNVVWYPGVKQAAWMNARDNPYAFTQLSSSQPVFATTPQARYFINYLLAKENVSKIPLGEALNLVGVKYLIIRNDDPQNNQEKLLAALDRDPTLQRIQRFGFLYIYKNLRFTGLLQTYSQSIQTDLGLEILKHLSKLNLPTSNLLIDYIDSGNQLTSQLKTALVITDTLKPQEFTLARLQKQMIFPYRYTPFSFPYENWARGSLVDLTHAETSLYFKAYDISNPQFDFGEGIVMTENNWQLKEGFNYKEVVSQAPYLLSKPRFGYTFDPHQATNPYWYIVQEDEVSLEGAKGLLLTLKFGSDLPERKLDEDLLKFHLKLDYYDADGNLVHTDVIIPNLQGRVRRILRPPLRAESVRLSYWSQVLGYPYKVTLKNLTLSNVSNFVRPIRMQFKTSAPCRGECLVFARVLNNPAGGWLSIRVDERTFEVETRSSQGRFRWVKLGSVNITKPKIKIEFTNLAGFNAINALLLISPQDYQNTLRQTQEQLARIPVIELKKDSSPTLNLSLNPLPQGSLREGEVKKISPTHYRLRLNPSNHTQPQLLVLKKPYDPNWILKDPSQKTNKPAKLAHGFVNGWQLTDSAQEFNLYYRPQQYLIPGRLLALITLLLSFLYLGYTHLRSF